MIRDTLSEKGLPDLLLQRQTLGQSDSVSSLLVGGVM